MSDWRHEPGLAPGESYEERTVEVPLTLRIEVKAYHRPSQDPAWAVCVGPQPMPSPDSGFPSERAKDFKSGVDALVARAVKALNANLAGTAFMLKTTTPPSGTS